MIDRRRRKLTAEEKQKISDATKKAMARPEVMAKLSPEKMARIQKNKGKKFPGSNPHGIKRDFVSRRDQGLFYEYGIRESDYNNMFSAQGGKCLGCGKHQSELRQPLHVDHDHKTHIIRGLLCKACNAALGNVFDDIDILENLVSYLEENKCPAPSKLQATRNCLH